MTVLTVYICFCQVLYERGKTSLKTLQVINTHLLSAIRDGLAPGTEFWDSSKTLRNLAEEKYFQDEEGKLEWPGDLEYMISDSQCYILHLENLSVLHFTFRKPVSVTFYI